MVKPDAVEDAVVRRVMTNISALVGDIVARAVMDELRETVGGRKLYIPVTKERHVDRAAVRALFNGRNREWVMAYFQISKSQFYRLTSEAPEK